MAVEGPRRANKSTRDRIDEIAALEHRGRESEQKPDALLVFGMPVEPEVLLERHPAGQEIQQRDAHPERRCGRGRHPAAGRRRRRSCGAPRRRRSRGRRRTDRTPRRNSSTFAAVTPRRAGPNFELGIDVTRHLDEDVELRPSERRHRRADLAIEVREIEGIELGEIERADPESRERQQMKAADAAEARDRNALPTQRRLLGLGHPADVAGERSIVVEGRGHSRSLRSR